MASANHVDVKDYAGLGLAAAARAVRENQLSVTALVEACLASVRAREDQIYAFSGFDAKQAGRSAYISDRMPANKRGPLHGVPIAFTDLIDCSSKGHIEGKGRVSDVVASKDAQVVAKVRSAGGIILATAATAEFGAFGSGTVRNPLDIERSLCGSGAAAAIAAKMVPLAFDLRVDGPITRAAAACGIYGLTATRRAIPSEGVLSLAPSIETCGFHVRDAEDVGFACRHILGRQSIPENRDELAYRTKGLKVALLEGPASHTIEAAGRSAMNRAATALMDARIETARLRLPPRFVKVDSCYDTLFSYELARRLTADRDRLSATMNTQTLAQIDHGRRIEASDYEQARRDAITLRSELLDMMKGDTVFLDAAMVGPPPLRADGDEAIALHALWAIIGAPVLAVPCGFVDGLPISVQIAAAPGREDLLARLACIIEDRIGVAA